MKMDKRDWLRLSASMEGKAVVVANIGKRVLVSEMELICLVNFAEIAVMEMFSNMESEDGIEAGKQLEQLMDRIRETFHHGDGPELQGLNRLLNSTCALLRSEKFSKYIV